MSNSLRVYYLPILVVNLRHVLNIMFPVFLAFTIFLLPTIAKGGDGWLKVADRDLMLSTGSALDFSHLLDERPAGDAGHIVATADGHFSFSKTPKSKVRFLCASQPYGVEGGFPDHKTADRYAHQLRIHGYNLARFHFVENVLMNGKVRDFDFDKKQLDRFFYFLSALKREGIYWILDGLSSWNGGYGDIGYDRWAKKKNVKLGLYLDPEQKKHWKRLVLKVLATENPYTGLRVLEDPALVGLILVNEGGLNFLIHLEPSAELDKMFEKWLQDKYGSLEDAQKKWGDYFHPKQGIQLPRGEWDASPKMADVQKFYYELQKSTGIWMSEYVRDLGYKGLITAYNNWPHLQDDATRAEFQWVDQHFYHDAPSNFVSPGSRIRQDSSIEDGLKYLRQASIGRHWGKPYSLTEYDQPFWSRWRYESGIAVGAIAAFQDWDFVCRHGSGPIELEYGPSDSPRRRAIHPYAGGMDPIVRANETLVALLFLRKDVSVARYRLGAKLTLDYVFEKKFGIGKMPDEVTRLGLLSGVGQLWNEKDNTNLDWVFDPGGIHPTTINKFKDTLSNGKNTRLSSWMKALQKRGMLASRKVDASSLYVSDTNEISINASTKQINVVTPRTEASAYERVPGKLDLLNIKESSTPALVSVSALDGEVLKNSSRILLIVATDARNTGMKFSDPEERELLELGRLPILIKGIRVSLSLLNEVSDSFDLYALRLNGERSETIPFSIENNGTKNILIDTSTLQYGPAIYFELVSKPYQEQMLISLFDRSL